MIKWAVKYGHYFSVYNSEKVARSVAKGFGTEPIKVRGLEDAGGVDYSQILGRIGNLWYVRCDNG